jgi:putative endonuclease
MVLMSRKRLLLGRRGERVAEKYIKRRGYKIIERNYRCSFGELDLIAEDRGVLVFVEVKARAADEFGVPQAAGTQAKQHKMAQLAQNYLAHKGLGDVDCRFDVVAVSMADGEVKEVELIKDAFQV